MPFKIEEANPLDGCGKEVGWKSMEDGEKAILMVGVYRPLVFACR